MSGRNPDISALLEAWGQGDGHALEELVPLVERELRRIARNRIARVPSDPLLTTTVLVQEAYLQLVRTGGKDWQGRVHFFALCSKIMRDILVDHARAQHASKRAGMRVPLDESLVISHDRSAELLAINEALRDLATVDPRKARVVELRFFGGMNIDETAEALRISAETVIRDWRLAKLWLLRHMNRGVPHDVNGVAQSRGTA